MRTTVRLDDALLEQAKAEAASRGQTLTSLIELGLRLALAQNPMPPGPYDLPVSDAKGGPLPGIDLNNNAQLLDIMDGFVDPPGR